MPDTDNHAFLLVPIYAKCEYDDDIDLDLTDYQALQAAFTGAITSGW